MLTKNQILKIERQSFILNAQWRGVDPERLAEVTCAGNAHLDGHLDEHFRALGVTPPKRLVYAESSVDSLIRVNRQATEQTVHPILARLARFTKLYGESFEVDSRRFSLRRLDSNSETAETLLAQLTMVPVVNLYTTQLDASVSYASDGTTKYVAISRSLLNLLENLITRIWCNLLFPPNSTGNVCSFPLVMYPSNAPPYDIGTVVDTFLNISKHHACHPEQTSLRVDKRLLRLEPAHLPVHMWLFQSMYEFLVVHEYAHLLYDGSETLDAYWGEIQADQLATNVVLLAPWLSPDTDDQSDAMIDNELAFRSLGPFILLEFLTLLHSVQRRGPNEARPHPTVRRRYVATLVERCLGKRPSALEQLQFAASIVRQATIETMAGISGVRLPNTDEDMDRASTYRFAVVQVPGVEATNQNPTTQLRSAAQEAFEDEDRGGDSTTSSMRP